MEGEVWMDWGFERAVLAGEVSDFASGGLGIESFDIAFFTGFEGGVDENFKEVLFADDAACEIAQFTARSDGGDKNDDTVIDKDFGQFCDAADVFQAVFIGESEVGVKTGAEVVTIKDDGEVALLVEDAFRGVGDGRFAGAGKATHPDGEPFLF